MKQILFNIAVFVVLIARPDQASAFDIEGWGKDAKTFSEAEINAKDDAKRNCGIPGYKSIRIITPCASVTIETAIEGRRIKITAFKCYYEAICNSSSENRVNEKDPLFER
jgi:hypothetical protein